MNIPGLLLLTVLCVYLVQGLPMPLTVKQIHPVPTTVRHRLLSQTTGRYVTVTKSGRVHANGVENTNKPAKDATPIIIDRLATPNHLRIASVKYSSLGWFLVLTEEGTIRAQVPSNGNEILEQVSLPGGFMALRVVNYESIVSSMEEGSGSQHGSDDGGLLTPQPDEEIRRECYIGFSDETGRAKCYDNTDDIHVRLQVIPND